MCHIFKQYCVVFACFRTLYKSYCVVYFLYLFSFCSDYVVSYPIVACSWNLLILFLSDISAQIYCIFSHSTVNGLLPMYIFVYAFWFIRTHASLRYMPRNITGMSLGMYIFSFTRYYLVFFQSGCTDLQPYQQCMRIPVLPIFINTWCILLTWVILVPV